MSGRIAWTLSETTTPSSYAMSVNPKEATAPPLSKSFNVEVASLNTLALIEKRDETSVISLQGVVLDKDQLDQMYLWFDKQFEITLTDDLGRQNLVYILSFAPTRDKVRIGYTWRHTYNMEMLVLG